MGQISSEQLMHFVAEQEHLVDILKHDFYPRLCREDQIYPFFKSGIYVAMKCFCDIPLSMIEKHMTLYGLYGVGFKKEWGMKIGLTPVVYYNPESPYIKHMKDIHNTILKNLPEPGSADELNLSNPVVDSYVSLSRSFTMYKPIYGSYERARCDHYNYYDEREWRYILQPDAKQYLTLYNTHLKDDFWNGYVRKENQRYQKNNQINFTYEDLEFVIIPSTAEKMEIIRQLKDSAIPKEELDQLDVKLLTYSEVMTRLATPTVNATSN